MLCLSRKVDERVRLRVRHPDGGHTDVWISVIALTARPWRVRLGVEAPQSVIICREEVIREQEQSA